MKPPKRVKHFIVVNVIVPWRSHFVPWGKRRVPGLFLELCSLVPFRAVLHLKTSLLCCVFYVLLSSTSIVRVCQHCQLRGGEIKINCYSAARAVSLSPAKKGLVHQTSSAKRLNQKYRWDLCYLIQLPLHGTAKPQRQTGM